MRLVPVGTSARNLARQVLSLLRRMALFVAHRQMRGGNIAHFSALNLVAVFALSCTAARGVGLPDPRQILCDDGTNNLVTCNRANAGDTVTYPRQDGQHTQKSAASGFGYTKVANNGSDLPPSATLGSNPTDWACTRDNITGLTWEVKTNDGGMRDMRWDYSWYNSTGVNDGGVTGTSSSGTCKIAARCDTEKFAQDVNAVALCSYTDWRIPSYRELLTLVRTGTQTLGFDQTYFPNTRTWTFWSASSYVPIPSSAWTVYFAYGYSGAYAKSFAFSVRLVRGGQT